jgi:hypothetical protein
MLLYIIIGLFAGAALMGIIMLTNYIKRKQIPKPVILVHGTFAASGLLLLLYYAFENEMNYPQYSLTAFLLAAIGGLFLLGRHFKGKIGPLVLILLHGLIAATGFVLLLLFVFG